MRGSGRMSTAANGVSSVCSAPAVRAEKPQRGASGVPFMKRMTSWSAIASEMASRSGFSLMGHSALVVRDRAWIGPPISAPKTA